MIEDSSFSSTGTTPSYSNPNPAEEDVPADDGIEDEEFQEEPVEEDTDSDVIEE